MSTIINATDVTVRYGDRAVLDSATLAIDEPLQIQFDRVYQVY